MPASVLARPHLLDREGRPVTVRPVRAEDAAALLELAGRLSAKTLYLRFFSTGASPAANYLSSLAGQRLSSSTTVLAEQRHELVGVASLDRLSAQQAEFSVLVVDGHQHEGLGSVLLQELVERARTAGYTTLLADVLSNNAGMHEVLRDLGLRWHASTHLGVDSVSVDLTLTDEYLAGCRRRETEAAGHSMRSLLAPRSVAVIGAGHRPGTAGHEVLRNLLAGGYPGEVFVVNPARTEVLGIPSRPRITDLTGQVELAIIAVPPAAVLGCVRDCGQAGVAAVLVVTSGFGEAGTQGRDVQQEIARTAAENRMRLLGPNCLGVLNTDPAVRLNGTFAPMPLGDGGIALVSQSGALGIGLATACHRAGTGLSHFVSLGNKADITSSDLIMDFGADDRVRVMALYLESLGEPRRLVRIASEVTARKPILALKSGRTGSGKRAGMSHTAAAATDDVLIDMVFEEAGIVRVADEQALLDASRLLAGQPLPAGPRVAIVGNSGGPQILTADAAESAGLTVPALSGQLQDELAQLCPGLAAGINPVDLGAGTSPASAAAAVAAVARSGQVDAVIVVFTQTLLADSDELVSAVAGAAAGTALPVLLVRFGENDDHRDVGDGQLPIFRFGEQAAVALATAWRCVGRRTGTPAAAELEATRRHIATVRRNVESAVELSTLQGFGDGWLEAGATAAILDAAGIPGIEQVVSADPEQLLAAASRMGYPVCLKPAGGLVHKSDTGAVRTGIADADQLGRALAELTGRLGSGFPFMVQAMAAPGAELLVGAIQAGDFGPVVSVGVGGTMTDLIRDRGHALAPTTPARVHQLLGRLRCAALLDGFRGLPSVDRDALAELVVRVSHLISAVDWIAELDLNPVICAAGRLQIVDAKIRIVRD